MQYVRFDCRNFWIQSQSIKSLFTAVECCVFLVFTIKRVLVLGAEQFLRPAYCPLLRSLDSTYIVMDPFAATPGFILFDQIINPQVTIPALN